MGLVDTKRPPLPPGGVAEDAARAFLEPMPAPFSDAGIEIRKAGKGVWHLTYYGDVVAIRKGGELNLWVDPMSWWGGILQSLVSTLYDTYHWRKDDPVYRAGKPKGETKENR